MRIIQDGLKFCEDCACWAANADDSGIDCDTRRARVHDGVASFGPGLVSSSQPGDDDEWCSYRCDSCGYWTEGTYHVFSVLGPDEWACKAVDGAKHDGQYILRDGKRYARWVPCGRGNAHAAEMAPTLVSMLNAQDDVSKLLALVGTLLDQHEAADQPEDYIEARTLRQLTLVKRRLGIK